MIAYLWNFFYRLYKFIYIYLIHTDSQHQCSLIITDRPLILSYKRRLYLHLNYFKFRATFFFHPKLVVLLSLKEIVVEGLPYLFRLRTFPAKDPLLWHLGLTFSACHALPFTDTD